MKKKFLAIMMALTLSIGSVPAYPVHAAENDSGWQTCDVYTGSNTNAQSYGEIDNSASPIYSYLTSASNNRIMRLQRNVTERNTFVEYLNDDYQIIETKKIEDELPGFGGFYETDSYYFIMTGNINQDESPDVETFRVTKYDKDWNRITSASLYGCNTTIPFSAGSVRMDHSGKYLIIRTNHTMYQSDDGLCHQSNATFQLDMEEMKFTDYYVSISNINYGYVSHSFNQFIKIEGNHIVAVDHGDAYPRSIALIKYSTDISTGKFVPGYYDDKCTVNNIIEFPGSLGQNRTNASVGGFEISNTSYLVAGNSVIQDENNLTRKTKNIFIASVDKETEKTTINWLTDYPEGEDTTYTPHLVKLSGTRFMLLWGRTDKVYYTIVNDKGQSVSEIHELTGKLSDCVPTMIHGKLVWYEWNNEYNTFYEIDPDNLSNPEIHRFKNGHDYEFKSLAETGYSNVTCNICHEDDVIRSAFDLSLYWVNSEGNGYYWKPEVSIPDDSKLYIQCEMSPQDFLDQKSPVNVEIEDNSIVSFVPDNKEFDKGYFVGLKPGTTAVTVSAKYNPTASKTATIRVYDKETQIVSVELEKDSFAYTGQEIKPKVTVKAKNGTVLTENKDYLVFYEDNTDIGTAYLEVYGYGNYNGYISKQFTITEAVDDPSGGQDPAEKIDISNIAMLIPKNSYEYTGTKIEPVVTVEGLTENTDYTVSYSNNTNAGNASVTVTGIGDYTGTKTLTFTITPKQLSEEQVAFADGNFYEYTGAEIRPTVNANGILSTDYVVGYCFNTNAGNQAYATVTGINNYTGMVTLPFEITPKSFAGEINFVNGTSYEYTGSPICPAVTLEDLSEGIDYTVSYENHINAGTGTVTVTGVGNYTGTKSKNFTIIPKTIDENLVQVEKDTYEYTGKEIEPAVTVTGLVHGTDYEVSYSNHKEIGAGVIKITGKGNYKGTVTKSFTIKESGSSTGGDIVEKPINIQDLMVSVPVSSFEYTGKEIQPDVIVQADDKVLSKDTNYTVTYENNVSASENATIILQGIGAYSGTMRLPFTITPKKLSFKKEEVKLIHYGFSGNGTEYYYTGREIQPLLHFEGLQKDKDYTITYKNNIKIGTATILVTFRGNYSGTYTHTFKIVAKPVRVTSVKISGESKSIAAGKKITLTAKVYPSNATKKSVKWVSSNTKVATVTQNGVVTMQPKSGGKSVTITALATDGSGKKATYKIKSMKGYVKKVTISGKKSIKAGKSTILKAKVSTTTGSNKKLIWSSSNTKYATVSSSGKVTTTKAAKGKSIIITARATDGTGKKATFTMKIK